MMSAFYNGVEGVKTQNFGIDITANNIANVNTTGYKYSGAEFKDIFYTTVSSQSTNPAEKGFASSYAASKLYFEQGSPMASEGEFDVALQGKGFFGVLGADGQVYYTRNGSFRRDAAGNLVDSYGNFVLGTMNPAFAGMTYSDRVAGLMGSVFGTPVRDGFTVSSNDFFDMGTVDSQGGLFVPTNMYLPPQTTKNVKWSGSLDSSVKTETVMIELNPDDLNLEKTADGKFVVSGSLTAENSLGAKAGDKVILNFTDANGVRKSFEAVLDENLSFKSNELDLAGLDEASLEISSAEVATEQPKANKDTLEAPVYNDDGSKSTLRLTLERIFPDVDGNIQYKVTAQIYDSNGEAVGEPTEGNLVFNEYGALIENNVPSVNNPNGGTINLDLGTPYDPNIAGSGYGGVYIKEGVAKDIVTSHDGVVEGFFEQYDIAEDGSIVAAFSNGRNAIVGKLALYNFINEQGLAMIGDNIFAATGNSGEASFIMSNGELVNTAKFRGGYLEQSNVSLGTELSNLIVMQKAFDASSKSITTSDQMIQKAINMKR